jgi:hypothetical protein
VASKKRERRVTDIDLGIKPAQFKELLLDASHMSMDEFLQALDDEVRKASAIHRGLPDILRTTRKKGRR